MKKLFLFFILFISVFTLTTQHAVAQGSRADDIVAGFNISGGGRLELRSGGSRCLCSLLFLNGRQISDRRLTYVGNDEFFANSIKQILDENNIRYIYTAPIREPDEPPVRPPDEEIPDIPPTCVSSILTYPDGPTARYPCMRNGQEIEDISQALEMSNIPRCPYSQSRGFSRPRLLERPENVTLPCYHHGGDVFRTVDSLRSFFDLSNIPPIIPPTDPTRPSNCTSGIVSNPRGERYPCLFQGHAFNTLQEALEFFGSGDPDVPPSPPRCSATVFTHPEREPVFPCWVPRSMIRPSSSSWLNIKSVIGAVYSLFAQSDNTAETVVIDGPQEARALRLEILTSCDDPNPPIICDDPGFVGPVDDEIVGPPSPPPSCAQNVLTGTVPTPQSPCSLPNGEICNSISCLDLGDSSTNSCLQYVFSDTTPTYPCSLPDGSSCTDMACVLGALEDPVDSGEPDVSTTGPCQGVKDFKYLLCVTTENIVKPLAAIIVALTFLYFLWGIAKYLKAGDKDRQGAKEAIFWSIIVLFVMVSVWGLVNILIATFDLDNTRPPVPSVSMVSVNNSWYNS